MSSESDETRFPVCRAGGILVLLPYFGEKVFTGFGEAGCSGILYSFRGIGGTLMPIMVWHFLGETKAAMCQFICKT